MFTLNARIGDTHDIRISCVERADTLGNFYTWYLGMLVLYPVGHEHPPALTKVDEFLSGKWVKKFDVPEKGIELPFYDKLTVWVEWVR